MVILYFLIAILSRNTINRISAQSSGRNSNISHIFPSQTTHNRTSHFEYIPQRWHGGPTGPAPPRGPRRPSRALPSAADRPSADNKVCRREGLLVNFEQWGVQLRILTARFLSFFQKIFPYFYSPPFILAAFRFVLFSRLHATFPR